MQLFERKAQEKGMYPQDSGSDPGERQGRLPS